ncbi:MAG: DUF4349 domain-containing protein [Candidatus Nanohaloarchaea archaeon]
MKVKKKFQEMDRRFRIFGLLAVVLAAGLIASSFSGMSQAASGDAREYSSDRDAVALSGSGGREKQSDSASPSGEKIVTTVRATLKVGDVESSMEKISSAVEDYGGFVESSSIERDRENRGSMTVKVPDSNLSEFEKNLERWKIRSKNVDRRDVSDSYSELEAEIESLRKEQRRLEELMNRTKKVKTLIKLQERMSEIRSRLDYKTQRFEELKEDVQYSRFYIDLEGPQGFQSRFDLRETFSDAYRGLFKGIRLMIVGGAYIVPFAAIYLLYRLVLRLKRRL